MNTTHTHDHDHHDHDHDHHDHDHAHAQPVRAIIIRESIKTALLVGFALYFGWLILSDNLPNYINYRFAWLAYVAFVTFSAMATLSAWHLFAHHLRGGHTPADHAHPHPHAGDHGDHTHAPVTWSALGIIAFPILLGTLIPSQPLGAEAVGSISTTGGAVQAVTMENFNIAPERRNVLDWLRTFNNAPDYRALNDQPVDVIGFVYTEPDFDAGMFMVARFTVSCCVADASAIGLPVAYADVASLPQGDWVRVQGVMQVGDFRGETLPVVQAASIEVVTQPDHPYLYP